MIFSSGMLPYLIKLSFNLLIFSWFSSPLLLSFLSEVSSVVSVIRGGCEYFFIFTFFSFPCLLVQLDLNPAVLCLCVVRRHHRARVVAGGVPAVGCAADVVVLASLLHCGKFERQYFDIVVIC